MFVVNWLIKFSDLVSFETLIQIKDKWDALYEAFVVFSDAETSISTYYNTKDFYVMIHQRQNNA